ncbi:MAG: hypothetical protein M1818_005757 [Claussenomyces sp. TS43310]|nr:MAG: hypothetical protein M1818_005757 [Claussenomyces sp. TS43310]
MSGIKIIFGCALVQTGSGFATPDAVESALDVLSAAGVGHLDTAQLYGDSEDLLGQVKAGRRFVIDTKVPGGFREGTLRSEALIEGARRSLGKLGVDKVDVFYIHAPDAKVPLEDWLPGLDQLHKSGVFSRFGVSNFKAEEVQRVYDHCKEKGYVLPSVYQGNYSAVARLQETLLLPTLRKLKISFYAYSPIAGGFLTRTKESLNEEKGRFDTSTAMGERYNSLYSKPALLAALEKWDDLAAEAGCEKAEVAYRWVAWNSVLREEFGDAIIVGASKLQQLEQSLAWLKKGPLDEKTCKAIDDVWKTVQHEAPLDNYNR